MKRLLINYFIVAAFQLLVFPNLSYGQQWYFFEGYVLNIDDETPIVDHPVFIQTNDSINFSVVYTNDQGQYLDSVFLNSGDTPLVVVSTFDCYGFDHSFPFFDLETYNEHSFEICTETNGCTAFFFHEYDMQDSLLVYFIDFSEGDIDQWTWDFGDGNSSIEQNPSHFYNSPGFYEVCLTVENTSDSCYSLFCEEIFVGQNNCQANYTWEQSYENPLDIDFIDLSIGDIAYWYWDFGDGYFSEEESPSHQYDNPGQYWVGLMVVDSLETCLDEVWQFVNVFEDSIGCEAAFDYSLDTLNNTPFVYNFSDISEGNIESWYWEFGDGQFSFEQNPQHIYAVEGTYEVCLTISSSPNGGNCASYYCVTLQTPAYYNFGGQVFIDGFTINIDSADNANVAMAYLYRRYENQWHLMDQREFWKYGYYWFVDKPEGEYLLRADLLEGSFDFGNYVPSYYKEAINWQYGDRFYLSNNEEFAVNIDLKKLLPLQSGIASLSGYLQIGVGCSYSIEMENQQVQLFNAENQIVAYDYTDEYGQFSFNGLPFGQYKVKAEFTGNSSTSLFANLNNENAILSDIELTIDCNSYVGTDEYLSENNLILESVYPLPADDFLNLRVNANESMETSLEIYNLNGQVIFENMIKLGAGEHQLTIPSHNFMSGMYLLKMSSVDGKHSANKKIIINH